MYKSVLTYLSLAIVCLLFSTTAFSQNITLKGKITAANGKESLLGATVLVKGTSNGVATDPDGKFELTIPDTSAITLVVSYVGYETREVNLQKPYGEVVVDLPMIVIPGQQVVVTASRVSESILEAPVSIQKVGITEIRTSSSGDFYQSLNNLQEVDIVTSSLGFKVFNTRGFNTTAPVRSVQFIDGMDNQAPGLNFPVGNLVGANDLDLQSVEVISGAASALYGPNAFQGVLSMTTKNPYDYPGLSVQLKGGSRQYIDGQIRYARAFGAKKKFAFKITGAYMQAEDWPATDTSNVYGDIETDQNISSIIRQLPNGDDLTQEERDDFIALNNWLDFNRGAFPGVMTIKAPGYNETDLADYGTKSLKLAGSAHYRFGKGLEASYTYRFGLGTAIYQGTNRYSINDIKFQQHKLELTGKNFFVRAYTTQENAGDSYDMVFTAVNISKAGVANYISEYLGRYFDELDTLTNGFCADCLEPWMVDTANARALLVAQNAWYKPGSREFDSLYNEIKTDPNLQTGAQFVDRSALQHIEGQYQFTQIKWLDLLAGASFRRYNPQSFGTIFSDTLVNAADTLSDGDADPDAEYVELSTYEYGGYVQASKSLFSQKLKLIASLRVDKNRNYDVQFSPRGSIIFSPVKNHNIRVSGQSAFRAPTLQNQYILLDLGPITLVGNLNGFDNVYSLQSVKEFQEYYDTTFLINTALLQAKTIEAIQPEQVKTLEFGYRGIISNKLYIDFSTYFNWYTNFIGDYRVVRPIGGQAGEESGEDAILTESYQVLQVPVNAKNTVRTMGAAIGFSYYLGKGLTARTNYTWSRINENDLAGEDIIPGFNTPMHKFNIGFQGKRVWKGLGFNTNFRWQSDFQWESPFGDGEVPSFYTVDAQVNYELKDWYTTLAVGGSNITNNKHREAFGSPLIGGMVYASLLFDINKW